MLTKNKKTSLQKKIEPKYSLVKIAREAKKERLNRLSWNM